MQVTDWISAILIGIAVGVLGRLALPGRQNIGVVATLLIGFAAALLGFWVADGFGVHDSVDAHLWSFHWDWWVLLIQVGFAVVGVGLANALTYTVLADNGPVKKRRRRTTTKS